MQGFMFQLIKSITLTNYLGYDPEFSASPSIFGQGVDMVLSLNLKQSN